MKRKQIVEELHVCDDCARATYDTKFQNLSLTGEPTLVICELHPFPKIVAGSRACENFQPK